MLYLIEQKDKIKLNGFL